ncbi:Wzz/FepE/Etk N-terminal domain-containing protein [Pseudothauera rhizosphaerae]|nr:Wzz/FepE/Etk N-terminal domain-containing protein [Pseudothauera rhizosphaerae]
MHNSQPTRRPHPDDEVDLLELWRALVKRKWLVLSSFAFCVAVGGAYAFLQPSVYEASIRLRIGQIQGSSGALENAAELGARVMAEYGERVAEGVKRDRPFVTKASVQKDAATTLQLTVEGDTPADAARLLQQVTGGIQDRHNTVFEENLKPMTDRLSNLDEQIAVLKQQYDETGALLEALKGRDNVQASLVMLELGPIANSISQLDAERFRLRQQITPPQSRATELLGDIVAPTEPSRPKRALAIVLAAILGLLGGMGLAFAAESVSKARNTAGE